MNHHDDLDRRLDEQLRAAFAPLPPERLGALARAARPATVLRSPWSAWLLATAALCVVTFFFAQSDSVTRDGSEVQAGDAMLGAMWTAAYEDATGRGFSNCCGGSCGTGSFDLAEACGQHFKTRLQVADNAAVELLGAYQGLPTGGYMTLLAETDRRPVCVFVLPLAQDRRVELPAGKGLHLGRREVGDLVLYALSTAPVTSALAEFVAP